MINQDDNTDNEDKYEPADPCEYSFDGLKNLHTNMFDSIPKNVSIGRICAYRVNNSKRSPFLEYLLYLNADSSALMFPELQFDEECTSVTNEIIKMNLLLTLLFGRCMTTSYTFIDYYKGYYIKENEIIIFYDLTNMEMQLYDIYKESACWFCLVHEILNSGHMSGMKIASSAANLLTCESEYPFYVLRNELDVQYECPVVVYTGAPEKNLNFTYTFGVTKKDNNALFGPHYYFTDFDNAVNQGGWSATGKPESEFDRLLTDNEYGRYVKGGIVRFALFLGRNKVQMNLITDGTDDSQTKKERLIDNHLDSRYEANLSQISDHDGKWANDYDSIVAHKLELQDGSRLKNAPIYACKNYEQFCPLSYHYLKKSTLGEKYDEQAKYDIM